MRISLLDDIPLPPRKAPVAPSLPERYVDRSDIFGPPALTDGESAKVYVVFAPSFEELKGTCIKPFWHVALRVYNQVFSSVRAVPLSSVIAFLKGDEEYQQIVEGTFTHAEAMGKMGFKLLESRDTVHYGGGEAARFATVCLDGEPVQVEIDPKKGPISEGVAETMGYCGMDEGHRFGGKRWATMSSTEREVWLIIVAQHKRTYEAAQAAKEAERAKLQMHQQRRRR